MVPNKKNLCGLLFGIVLTCNLKFSLADIGPKDNGDIYVLNDDKTNMEKYNADDHNIDFEGIMSICNSSFSIPMEHLVEFNNTGELPNAVDKTGPCYIRCFYEKSGFINDWKLNAEKIRQYMWPATGDSIQVCQEEGKTEPNACVRTYAIAKCLMIRAIVDARNKPMK